MHPVLHPARCFNDHIRSLINKKESLMKTISRNLVLFSGKMGGKIRLIMFMATLVLFVLAAGAPMATGTVGG